MKLETIRPTRVSSETYYKFMIAKLKHYAEKFMAKEYIVANGGVENNAWINEIKDLSHVYISKIPEHMQESKLKIYKELEEILDSNPENITEIVNREIKDDVDIIGYYIRLAHAYNTRDYSIDLERLYKPTGEKK